MKATGIDRQTYRHRIESKRGKVELVVAGYLSGTKISVLAEHFNETRWNIREWLRKSGIISNHFIPAETKEKIAKMYTTEKAGIPTIAKRLGLNNASVRGVLISKGIARRTAAEAHALTANKRKYPEGKGARRVSTKTGRTEQADSTYELARMKQLDKDPMVLDWTREGVPPIPYSEGKAYVPDFLITMADGTMVVEEIKPTVFVNHKTNIQKFAAAKQYCEQNGMQFRVLTEKEIGKESIVAARKEHSLGRYKYTPKKQPTEEQKQQASKRWKENYYKNREKILFRKKQRRIERSLNKGEA